MSSGSTRKQTAQILQTTFTARESFDKKNENIFLRSLTIDKWSHVAAVWDGNLNKANLFLNSERLGSQSLTNGSYPRDNSHSVYDIGLKRDSGTVLRGHLRDLMVVGRAITGEELLNMAGKSYVPSCGSFWLSKLFLIPSLADPF